MKGERERERERERGERERRERSVRPARQIDGKYLSADLSV